MSKKNILFITEGKKDEPNFINIAFNKLYPKVQYEYYSYCTNIHTLSKILFDKKGNIDEYLDIKGVLKEQENNKKFKEIYPFFLNFKWIFFNITIQLSKYPLLEGAWII